MASKFHFINQNHAEIMCNIARDILICIVYSDTIYYACAGTIIKTFGLRTQI